jgi:uncharacterized membrane protein
LFGISSSINSGEDTTFLVSVIQVVLSIVLSIISVGYQWYCLNVARNQSPEPFSIFEILTNGRFVKVIKLLVLVYIKVLLWSLLFIVPGIIKAYSYSQSFYILYDNPDWTASQCIEESKRMMQGNKAELFVFQMSFIGWALVAWIVLTIVMLIVGIFSATVGTTIGYLLLTPFYVYTSTSLAGYYNALYMNRYNQYQY